MANGGEELFCNAVISREREVSILQPRLELSTVLRAKRYAIRLELGTYFSIFDF